MNTSESRGAPSGPAAGLKHWAALTPDALALVDRRDRVTFAELDVLAGAVAEKVDEYVPRRSPDREPGIASSWLPVIVDRSARAGVALHGAIRAGRPFAPLDASMPRERLAEILRRLGDPSVAVVADVGLAGLLPAGIRTIVVPEPGVECRTSPLDPQEVEPDHAGMVLFTSGSTGRPKGVIRHWRSFDRLVALERERYGDVAGRLPTRGVLQPFGFTGGLRRLLGGHSLGSTVVIDDPSSCAVDTWLEWLTVWEVTDLSLGAALASTAVRVTRGRRGLPTVKYVVTNGQALPWHLVEPIRRLTSPDAVIAAGLGSTESGTLFSYTIDPDHPILDGFVPVGRPWEPSKIRLASVDGPGSPTQLLVADPEIVEYLDDPVLNAERFEFDENGTRWWRSGDALTVDEEGVYHHRGRLDEMVKINGLLVEPREAEVALLGIRGIAAAVVMPFRSASGRTRLVAHVQVDDPDLDPGDVNARLTEQLPNHLRPALLVRHEQLPTTERGKLDRRTLELAELKRWRHQPVRQPGDDLAMVTMAIVGRILDLTDVGPDDDIWQLGCDSLAAVELCAALADAGWPTLNPISLLEHRTPAAISTALRTSREIDRRRWRTRGVDHSTAVVLNSGGTSPPIFALPSGGSTAMTFHFLAEGLGPDQPIVVVEPMGLHVPGRLDRTIVAMAERARAEVEHRLTPGETCIVLGYSAGVTVAFELCHQLTRQGRPVHLVLLDAGPGVRQQPQGTTRPAKFAALSDRRRVARAIRNRLASRSHFFLSRVRGKARYDLFQFALVRTRTNYVPKPALFPATVVQVEGNDVAARTGPLVPSLDVHEVGGDHHTMMFPPHVDGVVDAVRDIIVMRRGASPSGAAGDADGTEEDLGPHLA